MADKKDGFTTVNLRSQMGSQDPSKPSVTHKIVVLGDMGVGKTCISWRYYSGKFTELHDPTIGGSFLTKDVELDTHIVKFDIWDTAGQERYRSLAQMYYK